MQRHATTAPGPRPNRCRVPKPPGDSRLLPPIIRHAPIVAVAGAPTYPPRRAILTHSGTDRIIRIVVTHGRYLALPNFLVNHAVNHAVLEP